MDEKNPFNTDNLPMFVNCPLMFIVSSPFFSLLFVSSTILLSLLRSRSGWSHATLPGDGKRCVTPARALSNTYYFTHSFSCCNLVKYFRFVLFITPISGLNCQLMRMQVIRSMFLMCVYLSEDDYFRF